MGELNFFDLGVLQFCYSQFNQNCPFLNDFLKHGRFVVAIFETTLFFDRVYRILVNMAPVTFPATFCGKIQKISLVAQYQGAIQLSYDACRGRGKVKPSYWFYVRGGGDKSCSHETNLLL